jgi:hypothetical protein
VALAIDEDLERAKRDLENKIFFDKVIMKQVKVIFVERLKGARKKRRRVVCCKYSSAERSGTLIRQTTSDNSECAIVDSIG